MSWIPKNDCKKLDKICFQYTNRIEINEQKTVYLNMFSLFENENRLPLFESYESILSI